MAHAKRSWSARRWKIFQNVYEGDEKFRKKLTKLHKAYPDNRDQFEDLLISYQVPLECERAIIRFLNHPNLKGHEYLDEIRAPLSYWNAEAGYMGPNHPDPARYYKMLCENIKDELGVNDFLGVDYNKMDFEALVRLFGNMNTVLNIDSFMTKTELHELIDDYWDELDPLINYRYETKDKLYSTKLLGKIQPAQLKKIRQRNALIMKLHEDGLQDSDIAIQLDDNGYGYLSLTNIRQIRHRIRKNKK